MLELIRNMSTVEFAHWYQRANGYRHETDSYWAARQNEFVRFLEEVLKHSTTA